MEKVGRNDPCPCGSGKKFKKCCINKAEIPPVVSVPFDELDLEKLMSNYDAMEIQYELEHQCALARYIDDPYALSNKLPCDDFDGLTPIQMLKLINLPFESPDIVEIPEVMDESPDTPIMALLATLLRQIGPTGIKLKKNGNLPIKVARELAKVYFLEDSIDELTTDGVIDKEGMFDDLSKILELAISTDIINCIDNTLSLGVGYLRLFKGDGYREYYPLILRFASEDYCWGDDDAYQNLFVLQDTFAYTLYLLHKYGDEFRTNTFYEDAILRAFPTIFEDNDGTAHVDDFEMDVRLAYTNRALGRYAGFLGLVEFMEYANSDDPDQVMLKKTPLLDDVVRFKI